MAKKPDITTIASGYYSRQALNTNFENLQDGFDNTLSLDGSTPNAMGADLDMNSNDILNASEIDTVSLRIDGVLVSAGDTAITSSVMSSDIFTGNGSTTVYTLSFAPFIKDNTQIYIDGVYQNKVTYATSGNTLTFTEAPPLNSAIEVMISRTLTDVGTADAGAVTYTQGASGSVQTTVQAKLQETVSVKDFGATGDGVTDDTAAIIAAANAMTDNVVLHFPKGTYIISHNGFSDFTDPYGNNIINISNIDNIGLKGDNAVIKCVNHDISTYGGLMFFKFLNCNGVHVSGFRFDMTFTGYKDSSSFYPFCGAIFGSDASSGSGQNPNDLSGDILVQDCEFKIFHPLGSYGVTTNPYAGDPNNGFKVFSFFLSSPFQALQYADHGRNVTIKDCIFKEGHNAYGLWVWATYNALFDNITSESWVTKSSLVPSGSVNGGGTPLIRHHQFRSEGARITNCSFRAKPSSERTVAGFEGVSEFIHFSTNVDEGLAKGDYIVANNSITHGLGDAANTLTDNVIFTSCYGAINIANNNFDGHDGETVNIYGASSILMTVANGSVSASVGSISISNNIWGRWSKSQNIQIATGNNSGEGSRRYEQVNITDNISLSQAQYFLFLGENATFTYHGVRMLNVSGNIIDGENSTYNNTSTNSFGMRIRSSESTDIANVYNNIIRNKYYGIYKESAPAFAGHFNTFGNRYEDVTDERNEAVVTEIFVEHNQGEAQAITDGVGGSRIIARESGSGTNIQIYSQASAQYLTASNSINFYTDGVSQVILDDNIFRPTLNGDVTLGDGTFKWGQIYSTSGTINTSDERQKQDIETLSQAELNVATALKGLIRKFRYRDAVLSKGDNARTHIGIIAQDVKAAFEAENLDSFEYGILCFDQWDDTYESDLNGDQVLVREAGEEYAIRYDELMAFIIAAL